MAFYQTVSADGITGAGMSITVTAGAGAKIGATGDTLKTRGTHLTGQACVSGRTPGNDKYDFYQAGFHSVQTVLIQTMKSQIS